MSRVKLGLVVQGKDLFAVHADEDTGVIEASQYLCEVSGIDSMIEALEEVKRHYAVEHAKPEGAVLH